MSRYRPHEALFPAALLFSVLPAAPVIASINRLVGTPVQGLFAALWLIAVLAFGRRTGGLGLAAVLALVGAVTALGDTSLVRPWVGVLLVPLALFVGLQAVDEDELRHARSAARWMLFTVCAVQVWYFATVAGVSASLSPSFVYGHHTDVALWQEAGRHVLANPTNASVVFCTAFAWAVGERAIGAAGRLSWAFLAVSACALFVTGSRGAWLTAGAVLLGSALFHARSRRRVVLTLVTAAGVYAAVNYWTDRYGATARTEASANARWEARVATVPDVIAHPFGHGVGTTADTLRPLLGGVQFIGSDTVGATSHDLFLNWAVCVGWIGLALLLAALAVGVVRSWRAAGPLTLLPLGAYLLAGESTGVDVLNSTNAAWSAVLWVLIGLTWRGGVLQLGREVEQRVRVAHVDEVRLRGREPSRGDRDERVADARVR